MFISRNERVEVVIIIIWPVSVCYRYVVPSLVHFDIGGWGYANQAVFFFFGGGGGRRPATFDDKYRLF